MPAFLTISCGDTAKAAKPLLVSADPAVIDGAMRAIQSAATSPAHLTESPAPKVSLARPRRPRAA